MIQDTGLIVGRVQRIIKACALKFGRRRFIACVFFGEFDFVLVCFHILQAVYSIP